MTSKKTRSNSFVKLSSSFMLCLGLVASFLSCTSSTEAEIKIASSPESITSLPLDQANKAEWSEQKQGVTESSKTTSTPPSSTNAQLMQRVQVIEEITMEEYFEANSAVLRMDISALELDNNPDTIQNYVNAYYKSLESNFPRSIACDFENGISTEQIHYPTILFTVKLFESGQSKKSYKTVEHTIYSKIDQEKIAKSEWIPVKTWVDRMPTIFTDKQDLHMYLRNSVNPPAKVKELGISGTSWLTFIVEMDGTISDLRVEKAFENCPECDEEVLRVARAMPRLNPGSYYGNPARVRINQGITF